MGLDIGTPECVGGDDHSLQLPGVGLDSYSHGRAPAVTNKLNIFGHAHAISITNDISVGWVRTLYIDIICFFNACEIGRVVSTPRREELWFEELDADLFRIFPSPPQWLSACGGIETNISNDRFAGVALFLPVLHHPVHGRSKSVLVALPRNKGAADLGWDYHRGHIKKESPGNSYWEWVERQGSLDEFQHDWSAEFGGKYPTADLGTRISKLPEDKTMEAFTARETVKFIREQKNRDKPFFCWVSFYRPHQPYNAQKRFLDMYDYSKWGRGTANGGAIKKPATLNQSPDSLPPALKDWHEGKNKVWRLDKAAKNEQLFRFYIASYYALVTEIDHHIGAIMKALEEEGLLENTIVVYTSDHGDFVGRHGMIEKCAIGHNVYEETLRVPLIVSHPQRIKRGQVIDDLVEMFDLYPTLLELAGVKRPSTKHGIDATSLVATLTAGKATEQKYIISENWSQASIITDRYKLGIWLDPTAYAKGRDFRSFGDMLFDREKDPGEINNLIDNPEYVAVEKRLRGYLDDFVKRIPATGKEEIVRRTAMS